MGVTSLILGILALIFAFIIPAAKWIGAILALIGIILGALGRRDTENHGLATGGMVCSIIAFVVCIIVVIACAACASGLASLGNSILD